jgi:predicted O-methyltransferase YrrM
MSARPQELPASGFSLAPELLDEIFEHARPLGHHEDRDTRNLGFGYLYYGLVRTLRPQHVVVIGSGFGFSVVCLALGLKDNGAGKLHFVDPSYSLAKHGPFRTIGGTSQWDDPAQVHAHFARFGVAGQVTHHRETSAEFFSRYEERGLGPIDLAFIDGNHSFGDVRHDFIEVMRHAKRNSYLLLHDTHLYLREMIRHAGVKRWLNIIGRDRDCFEVVDFPFSSGVALVRALRDGPWHPGA